jgi:hypothetical protein
MDALLNVLTSALPGIVSSVLPALIPGIGGLGLVIAFFRFALGYTVPETRKALASYGGAFLTGMGAFLGARYQVGVWPSLNELLWLAVASAGVGGVASGVAFQLANKKAGT